MAKPLPREIPSSHDDVVDHPTNVVIMEKEEEKNNQMEEPLVDLSEAKPDQEAAAVTETKSVEAAGVLVSELFDNAVSDKTEVETAEAVKEKTAMADQAVKEKKKVEGEEEVGKKQSGEIMEVDDDDAPPRSPDAPPCDNVIMTV